jgi:hypothetical protein
MPGDEFIERPVILRKLLARQILKLQGGDGGAVQPLWGLQGFDGQDPTLLVGPSVHSTLLMTGPTRPAFVPALL